MDIDVFPTTELPIVMRTLRTALRPDGPLQTEERAFLDTYARIVGIDAPPPDLALVAAAEVHVGAPHARKRLVQLAALAVLLGRPVRAGSLRFLRELARQLGTHDSVIDVIEALHHGRPLRARMIAMRRAFRVMLKEAYLAEGAAGVARLFAAMWFRATVNKDRLIRYKQLGLLPDGTLGREYWKHMTLRGFGFPGEPGGIAGSVSYHDVVHVLAGHDTNPEGEIQQGAFQAGNRREDGFFFLQFVILQFHHGIKITPVSEAEVGHFDPARVLWAIHRGASCPVDTTHQWNYWPLMALPLDEARARCAVPPPLRMAA
jgi:hypothetical protein